MSVSIRMGIVLGALVLLCPAPAAAQPRPVGPRSQAMGEVHQGIGTSNDALYTNPAGMSVWRRYAIEAFWRRNATADGNQFNVSIVDSQSGSVAGGIAYTYEQLEGVRSGSRVDMGASFPISQFILLGTTVRYLNLDVGGEEVNRVTGDVGLMVVPTRSLFIGVTGHNLLNPVNEAATAPRTLGAGVGLTLFGSLTLGVDYQKNVEVEGEPSRYAAGAEWFTLGALALRGGFVADGLEDEKRWTAGLGYVERAFGLDLSYARSLPEDGAAAVQYLAVGLRFFL